MSEPILLTHSGAVPASPAFLGPAVGMPAGTITGVRVLFPGGNVTADDCTLDLYINGAAQSVGLIVPQDDNEFTVTGLSIAVTDDDSAQFRIESPLPTLPAVPYHFYIYYTPTLADFAPASTTEVLTGTATNVAVTPDANAALWEQGSDVASAGTVSLGEGGYFNITGTTTITDIDFGTTKAGRKVWVKFAGILTLTHHATNLILPTGASITTAAGDTACFVSEGGDIVRCVSYQRADGTALVSGGFTAASTTEVLTGTDSSKGVTPDSAAALWEKGSDIASAGTISVGEGGYFHVTGTTTITDIDFGTDKTGRKVWLVFDGALTLTHNGTSLILPGGANITTAAGDAACFVSEGTDNIKCVAYLRASFLNTAADLQGSGLISATVGFRNIPQNPQTGNYTCVAADSGKHIYHASGDGAGDTYTIPANASVAFPVGTAITFINSDSNSVSIAITTDTMTLAGTTTTGTRTLAQNGVATATKVTSTAWIISGTGLT